MTTPATLPAVTHSAPQPIEIAHPTDIQRIAAELGATLVGLVVAHRGRAVTLSGRPGQWEAFTLAEPVEVEAHDVQGFGATAREALDACVDEAELVESEDEDDEDEDEDDEEE